MADELTTQVKQAEGRDPVRMMYDLASQKYELPEFESFQEQLKDDTTRRSFYDSLTADWEMPDYESFSQQIDPFLPKGLIGTAVDTIKEKGLVGAALSPLPDNIEEFLNTPLVDLRNLFPDDPPEGFESGPLRTFYNVSKGVAGFAEGMTTPLNIGLTIGTGGLGRLANIGSRSAKIVQAGKEALISPTAAFAGSNFEKLKLGSTAIAAIFSADMAVQLPGLWEDITESIEAGDMDTAVELITIGTLTAGTAGVLGKETASRMSKGKAQPHKDATGHVKRIERSLIDTEKAAALEKSMNDLNVIASEIKKHEAIEGANRVREGEFTRTEVKALTEADLRARRQQALEEVLGPVAQKERGRELTQIFTSEEAIAREQKGLRRSEFRDLFGRGKTKTEFVPTRDVVKTKPKITEKAVVKDQNLPVKEIHDEVAKIGDDQNLKIEKPEPAKKVESPKPEEAVEAPKAETAKPVKPTEPETRNFEVREVGKIKPEIRKTFDQAINFLNERFPRLMSVLDRVHLVDSETYGTLSQEGRNFSKENAFFRINKLANTVKSIDVFIKADNVISRDLSKLEASPQVMSTGAQKFNVVETPQINPTVEHFLQTIAHEFRHAKDLAHYGIQKFLALEELGSLVNAKGEPASLAKIERVAERQQVRGQYPQRYLAKLSERRARAQERTVLRAFKQIVQEKTIELQSKSGFSSSKFDFETYKNIKPNLESIWEEFRSRNYPFAEFEKTVREQAGKEATKFLDRFRQELEAEGRQTDTNPSEPRQSVSEDSNPDLVEKPNLPPETKISDHLSRFEDENSKAAEYAKKWSTRLANIFSVEHRYLDKRETAFHQKNFYGKEQRHIDEALKIAQDIGSLQRKGSRPDPQFIQEVAYLAEQGGLRKNLTPEQQAAVKIWDQYKQAIVARYKSLGETFNPKRVIGKVLAGEVHKRKEGGENVRMLEAGELALKRLGKVTPEASFILENLTRQDPKTVIAIYSELLRTKKREISLKNILETGWIDPDQVNIIDMIKMAGRRIGQDSAILEIRKAAVAEGLAKKTLEPFEDNSLWASAPAHTNFFDGYIVRTPLKEWLHRMTKPENKGWQIVDKGIASVKMAAFYNPFFLPMYDIYQAGMIGALKPHLIGAGAGAVVGGLPGAAIGFALGEASSRTLSRGFYHALAKTDRYFVANENGMSSVPYPNPFESHTEMFNRIKLATAPSEQFVKSAMAEGVALVKDTFRKDDVSRALQEKDWARSMKLIAGTFPRGLKNMYNLSWGIAWTLDRGVRMATYEYMRGQGFGAREAAQIAARAHGDYASVPMETRKMLNRVFFTPTFKIAMGKFQTEMVMSAIKGVKAPADVVKAAIGKTDQVTKLKPREAQMAAGLFYTGAILTAYHAYMTSQGFETDEFGIKYTRPTLTDEGPKDIVVTHSTPANLFIKYWNRIRDSFSAGPQPALKSLANRFSWEITPMFRIASNMMENKDDNGDPIILLTDDEGDKVYKYSKYALLNTYQMLGLLGTDEAQAEARGKLAEEAGQLFEMAVRPFTFSYLKDPEIEIGTSKINRLLRQFQRDVREGLIDPRDINGHSRNLMKQIEDIRRTHLERD